MTQAAAPPANPGNSPRAIALALCEALLADVERAQRSASKGKGLAGFEALVDNAQALWSGVVGLGVLLLVLCLLMPIWLAVPLTLVLGAGGLVLWLRYDASRPVSPALVIEEAAPEDQAALDASLAQLNTVLTDLQRQGHAVATLDPSMRSFSGIAQGAQTIMAQLRQL